MLVINDETGKRIIEESEVRRIQIRTNIKEMINMENFICQNCKAKYTNIGAPCIWSEQNTICRGATNIIGFQQQCEKIGYYKEVNRGELK